LRKVETLTPAWGVAENVNFAQQNNLERFK